MDSKLCPNIPDSEELKHLYSCLDLPYTRVSYPIQRPPSASATNNVLLLDETVPGVFGATRVEVAFPVPPLQHSTLTFPRFPARFGIDEIPTPPGIGHQQLNDFPCDGNSYGSVNDDPVMINDVENINGTANLSQGRRARPYGRFKPDEVRKLIHGVKKTRVEKIGNRWKYIKDMYFRDSARTKDQLKEKWRHMMLTAYQEREDSVERQLHSEAAMVELS